MILRQSLMIALLHASLIVSSPARATVGCERWRPGPFTGFPQNLGNGPVRAMITSGGVIAGGDFVYPLPGGGTANHLVRWNGTTMTALTSFPDPGEGTNGPVYALRATTSGPIFNQTTNTYIGGFFSAAGGVACNNIVRYATNNTTVFKSFNPMGQGFNNGVFTIESHGGSIYAGGAFSHSGGTFVNRVARWDGTSWQPVGLGLNGLVHTLKSYNGELYAGGLFGFTGTGASAPYIAKWNGTSWVSLGIGMNSGVHTMVVDTLTNTLILGGTFTSANGVPADRVARWNGSTFSAIGDGISGGSINALAFNSSNGRLLAGGFFNSPSDNVREYFSSWNTWNTALPNNTVHAMTFFGNELEIGGEFQGIGSTPSPLWARHFPFHEPWFTQQPQSVDVCPGGTAQFTFALQQDYTPLYDYQWKKDGVALTTGVQSGGSIILDVTSPTLTIHNATTQDAGSYACAMDPILELGNCQQATTTAVLLTFNGPCGCPADISGDGTVNVSDLLAVIGAWGACGDPGNCPADIAPAGPPVGNDVVNVEDMLAVIAAWGACL